MAPSRRIRGIFALESNLAHSYEVNYKVYDDLKDGA